MRSALGYYPPMEESGAEIAIWKLMFTTPPLGNIVFVFKYLLQTQEIMYTFTFETNTSAQPSENTVLEN